MSSALISDPRFIQGKAFVKAKQYDEAIEFFSNLLQVAEEKNGSDSFSLDVAPVWFQYGSALLAKEEENPSDDLLGIAAAEAKKAAAILSDELGGDKADDVEEEEDDDNDGHEANEDGDEEKGGGDEAEAGDGAAGADEEDDSDMAIAWEALEMSRKIYEQHQSAETDPFLADTHVRLGDLLRFNGTYEDAIVEYKKALELREAFCQSNDRLLSETHFLLAISHLYNSSEEGKDIKNEKRLSLQHYILSKDILHEASKICNEEDKVQINDTLDELQETIDSLKNDIEDVPPPSTGLAAQTTGFGFGKTPLATSSLHANSSSTSNIFAAAAANMSTIQVKKKMKPSDPAEMTGITGEAKETNKDVSKDCTQIEKKI